MKIDVIKLGNEWSILVKTVEIANPFYIIAEVKI